MVLELSKELQSLNYSEKDAFKKIFKDFWLENPTGGNWETKFKQVFSIKIKDFYISLSNYSNDISTVLPSENLLIEDILKN